MYNHASLHDNHNNRLPPPFHSISNLTIYLNRLEDPRLGKYNSSKDKYYLRAREEDVSLQQLT